MRVTTKPKPGEGIVRFVGWEQKDDGSKGDRFIATIEFPSGPPALPVKVVWDQLPVLVTLAPEE